MKKSQSQSKLDIEDAEDKRSQRCGCCTRSGIRCKTYTLIIVSSLIFANILPVNILLPQVTARSAEIVAAESEILTLLADFQASLDSRSNFTVATVADLKRRIIDSGGYGIAGPEDLIDYAKQYFSRDGRWDSDLYKNGFAVFDINKKHLVSEFHALDEKRYIVSPEERPLPEVFKGETEASRAIIDKILHPTEPWKGLIDKNETVDPALHYPFYFVTTAPFYFPEYNITLAWLVLFEDERSAISSVVQKLEICIRDFPGDAAIFKGARAKDVDKYTRGLKPLRTGTFSSIAEAGGNYRLLIHNQVGLVHEGKTMCGKRGPPIFVLPRTFGTYYFGIRSSLDENSDKALAWVRVDTDCETVGSIMNSVMRMTVIVVCFLLLLVVICVLYTEFGIMRRLDAAKKSIQKIILERRAIIEEYLRNDKLSRDYYRFSSDKENEAFDDIISTIALDTGGNQDEIALLMAMSEGIGKWMENILNAKRARVEALRRENVHFEHSLALLNAWSHRNDLRFSPSYVAADAGFRKNHSSTSDASAFAHALSLTHILGNGIALELFKAYCRTAGHEANINFVLDVAWLSMMEDIVHSGSGEANTTSSTSSLSVSSGSITHSQVVRMAQNIFSTYIFSSEHQLDVISLSPAVIKRLALRADARGRIKYSAGLFKSAASDIRRVLESDALPAFKKSPQFHALFMLFSSTSQVRLPSSGSKDVVVYSWPCVDAPAGKKDAKDDAAKKTKKEEVAESGPQRDELVFCLSVAPIESAQVDALVDEEKKVQKEGPGQVDIRATVSAPGLPLGGNGSDTDSTSSLPNPANSASNSKSKLRAVSPFSALLPGGRKKAQSTAAAEDDDQNDSRKGGDWMKRSFAMTKKDEKKDEDEGKGEKKAGETKDDSDDDKE